MYIGNSGDIENEEKIDYVDPEAIARSCFGSKTEWDVDFKRRKINKMHNAKEWRVPCHGYYNSTTGKVEMADGHENTFSVFSTEEAINRRRCDACEKWFVFPELRKGLVKKDGRSIEDKDEEFGDVCDILGIPERATKKTDRALKTERQIDEFDDETKKLLGI